jgi:hypothetical protein
VNGARRTGLEVHTVVTILEIHPESSDYAVMPLLRLGDIVCDLEAEGQLPENHAQAVLQSINP